MQPVPSFHRDRIPSCHLRAAISCALVGICCLILSPVASAQNHSRSRLPGFYARAHWGPDAWAPQNAPSSISHQPVALSRPPATGAGGANSIAIAPLSDAVGVSLPTPQAPDQGYLDAPASSAGYVQAPSVMEPQVAQPPSSDPLVVEPTVDVTGYGTENLIPTASPIRRWFGGVGATYWQSLGSDGTLLLATDGGDTLTTAGDVNGYDFVGYDATVGRYLCCGRYALGMRFFAWDPEDQQYNVANGGAGLVVPLSVLRDVSIDRGGGVVTVFDDISNNAANVCAENETSIRGFEANLSCFGLGGARRLGRCDPCGGCCGPLRRWCGKGQCDSNCCDPCARQCGGLFGPLARPCNGCVRLRSWHGLRYFQLDENFQIAADVDGNLGYSATDLFYQFETRNDLYGYQFGSEISYQLGCRLSLQIGGQFGVFANNVSVFHNIGNETATAFTTLQGAGAGDVVGESSDVRLATIGELNVGAAYQLCTCWTATVGYRLLSVCGVARPVDEIPTQYLTVNNNAVNVQADGGLMLHGLRFGLEYNW